MRGNETFLAAPSIEEVIFCFLIYACLSACISPEPSPSPAVCRRHSKQSGGSRGKISSDVSMETRQRGVTCVLSLNTCKAFCSIFAKRRFFSPRDDVEANQRQAGASVVFVPSPVSRGAPLIKSTERSKVLLRTCCFLISPK